MTNPLVLIIVFLALAAARTIWRRKSPVQPYQTFWPRFFAGWIDGFLLAPIVLLAGEWFDPPGPGWVIATLCTSSLSPCYEMACHARWGQTLGKWVFGVCVVDVSEESLRPLQAVKRAVVPLVVSLAWAIREAVRGTPAPTPNDLSSPLEVISLSWFLLEVVTMLGNKKRRAFHDYIAGTVVIRVIPLWWRTAQPHASQA